MPELPESDPESVRPEGFTPEQLDRTVLAIPLINDLRAERETLQHDADQAPKKWAVVLDINLEYSTDREHARSAARELVDQAIETSGRDKEAQGIRNSQSGTSQYLFATLEGEVIRTVVDSNEAADRPIFRIWPDFEIHRL